MKKQFKNSIYMFTGVAALMLASCNKTSLTDLNTDPNAIDHVIPEYLFTGAELAMPADNYGVIAQGMHYYSTYKEVTATGDKYYNFGLNNELRFNTGSWYTSKLNRLKSLMEALQGPDDVNKRASVRILRVYEFSQLTDALGDIPYSESLKPVTEVILQPKYDTQQSVYMNMLKELDEAATSFDAGKPTFGSNDLFYGGDVTRWRKFAYTMMLRLAMRLTNADPENSKLWVQKAIAGGVMTSDADIAKISYTTAAGGQNDRVNGLRNGNYISPGGDNVEGGKFAADFINTLKSTKDPRLAVISIVWKPNGTDPQTYTADSSAAVQRGMVSASLKSYPNDFDTYSEPSPLILNQAAPIIILGNAEANLLLAEAALRGWYNGGNAQTAYEAGVRAGMTQWKLWPSVASNSGVISDAQIDAYIRFNPYKSSGSFEEQLGQINTQKWLSIYGDDYEVFANWRRTGYPALTPTNYPGNVTGGKMFRRFAWPLSENLTNKDNYQAALARQGFADLYADNLLTRVWWDKPAK